MVQKVGLELQLELVGLTVFPELEPAFESTAGGHTKACSPDIVVGTAESCSAVDMVVVLVGKMCYVEKHHSWGIVVVDRAGHSIEEAELEGFAELAIVPFDKPVKDMKQEKVRVDSVVADIGCGTLNCTPVE